MSDRAHLIPMRISLIMFSVLEHGAGGRYEEAHLVWQGYYRLVLLNYEVLLTRELRGPAGYAEVTVCSSSA